MSPWSHRVTSEGVGVLPLLFFLSGVRTQRSKHYFMYTDIRSGFAKIGQNSFVFVRRSHAQILYCLVPMLLVRPLQVLPSIKVSMCDIEMSQLQLPDQDGHQSKESHACRCS